MPLTAHLANSIPPDLLPADVIGTLIFNPQTQDFSVKKGPIFANFVLADEINRAPAKVQSALLEAMQERQITIGGESHELPRPFWFLLPKIPSNKKGHTLYKGQVDRFLMKVVITYPSKGRARDTQANLQKDGLPKPQAVVNDQDILEARELVRSIYLDERWNSTSLTSSAFLKS